MSGEHLHHRGRAGRAGRRWRSRTSSTPPACARRTARRSSATTCRRRRPAAVRALEAAGYAMVGKANLHEFAWGITSENDHYGWVPNPARAGPRRRRVERRLRRGAGGRARRRGARQRLRRLDPDPGRVLRRRRLQGDASALVPIDGCWPLAPSYDTAGPMARDVAGCERMMEAMAPGFARADARLARRPARRRRLDRPRRPARARSGSRRPRRGSRTGRAGRPAAARRRLHRVRARGGRGPRRPVPRPRATLYGPTVAFKMRSALRDHRRRGRRRRVRLRELYQRARRRADGRPRPDRSRRRSRWSRRRPASATSSCAARMLELTFPWNAVGAPGARAARAGRPRTASPRRSSCSAGRARTRSCSPPGRLLEASL